MAESTVPVPDAVPRAARCTLRQLVAYMLKLGTLGFGGPVALVGMMHRDLVERRGWIGEKDYKEGLVLAQLMPGPLAAQLAMYLGYVHYGNLGATLVGVAFVLPSFLMVLALGWAYVAFGGIAWMQAVFYGVGAAVIAIISLSSWKLVRKTLGADRLLWALFVVSAVATVVTENEYVGLFLGAGVLVWLVRRPRAATPVAGIVPPWFFLPMVAAEPVAVAATTNSALLLQIAGFFAKAGAFVFGSGLAIVPFLYSGVVKEYEWMKDREFLDAVAVAMITPGPVVITTGFIGYVVAARAGGHWLGLAGASVAALATFLPCYLFTVIPAPYFRKHGRKPGLVAFVDGVTAAAFGAIAGACLVLARRTFFEHGWTPDWIKLALLAAAFGALLKFKKLPEPVVVLVAAALGLALHPLAPR